VTHGHNESGGFLALALLALPFTVACTHAVPVPREAGITTGPDAGVLARGRRVRRGRRRAVPVGTDPGAFASAHAPGDRSGDDLGIPDDLSNGSEEPAPRVRARMTETGPMLPENVGSPGNVSYDMTNGGGSGPTGLDDGQVARGLNPLLGRLSNCADATSDDQGHGPHGRVSIRLRIHSNGSPVAARVSGGNGSAEFITCVRRVIASAHFASFNGPDVFASWGFDVD
jgi:hypothetical protein